jgi:hypothetical protein
MQHFIINFMSCISKKLYFEKRDNSSFLNVVATGLVYGLLCATVD